MQKVPEHKLKAFIQAIHEHGPTRVMVNASGYALPPDEARERYGIEPEVVLIRDDGWSIGTPSRWIDHAMGLWSDYWIARIELRKE